jgi:urea carboxylase-associated protein 2
MDHPTSAAHAATPLTHDTRLEGGKHWSLTVRGGTLMRLVDLERGANVGMLFFNPYNLLERYNAPDTLKCQHTFKLTRGHCLYSDMGRIFCSVVEDTAGWHDTVCGNANRALVRERWGLASYQQCRNDWHQNGHDAFLVEGGKYGLGRRDLAANVNWFSRIHADEAGTLTFDGAGSRKGASVDLRFEMDTLVLLHTCPHPLNPASEYPKSPVRVELRQSPPVQADDYCLNACEENVRGFQNTMLYRRCGSPAGGIAP